ncbi:heavy metal-binding domain-containing protein [Dyella subtropica]|uniref:heavy metal-binding domain-containing protein n=1 Tax=Dyella subtropica TaxID=2992127 RepID=UPI00224F75BC|nr:heavy metal-binding domain-containing protein [Dyella subtropica]
MSDGSTIPQLALERLKGLRRQGQAGGIFTSDFSVNEFLLVRKAGFEPVGLCVGSCIYHLGIQYAKWGQNQEMTVLSQAMYHARELAMSRMREEAKGMSADGIVGVELTVKRMEWDSNILEFIAIGTGVVHAQGHQGFKGPKGQPFTSDLSGQDFWTLLQAGYRPLEMVMGSCVYHVAHQGILKSLGNAGNNTELTNFSQALYDAREIAMERMQNEAITAQAEGVVGVDLHEGSHNWQPHIIEFFAVGTAVTPITTERDASSIPDPQLVLSVNN